MITNKLRLALAGAAVLAGLAFTVTPALATSAPEHAANAQNAPAAAQAVWRGAYWNYYDCDVAGFSGVYYGYWTGYICQYRSGSNGVWDLYA